MSLKEILYQSLKPELGGGTKLYQVFARAGEGHAWTLASGSVLLDQEEACAFAAGLLKAGLETAMKEVTL